MKQKPSISTKNNVAIALRYDGNNAPIVTAKGKGYNAEEILRIAEENGIHVHSDEELVGLLSTIPMEHEIPRELYHAVAEILAFAYWLNNKTPEKRNK